jgi:hypothetical protein
VFHQVSKLVRGHPLGFLLIELVLFRHCS